MKDHHIDLVDNKESKEFDGSDGEIESIITSETVCIGPPKPKWAIILV